MQQFYSSTVVGQRLRAADQQDLLSCFSAPINMVNDGDTTLLVK